MVACAEQRVQWTYSCSMSFIQPMFHLKLKPRPPVIWRAGTPAARRWLSSAMISAPGIRAQHGVVQLLQKSNGLQVLVAAVDVGHATRRRAGSVIQVQHAGHRVHPQAVDVVLRQPVDSALEIRKLCTSRPAVIEHHGAPFLVLAAAAGSDPHSSWCRRTGTARIGPCGKWAGTQSIMTPMPA